MDLCAGVKYPQVHCSAAESSGSCWYWIGHIWIQQYFVSSSGQMCVCLATFERSFGWFNFFFVICNTGLYFNNNIHQAHCSFLTDFCIRSEQFGFSFCYSGKKIITITNCQEDIYVSVQNSFYLFLFTQCLSERRSHCQWLFMYRHYLTMNCKPSQCHFDFTLIFHFKEHSHNLYPSPHSETLWGTVSIIRHKNISVILKLEYLSQAQKIEI